MPPIYQAKSLEGKSWVVLSDVYFVSSSWISDRNWQFENVIIILWKETAKRIETLEMPPYCVKRRGYSDTRCPSLTTEVVVTKLTAVMAAVFCCGRGGYNRLES